MLKKIIKSERGIGLIEALVAVAILGIIAAAFLTGLFVSSKGVLLSDNLATAEGLARTTMEDIKEGDFYNNSESYTSHYSVLIPSEYSDIGYSITIEADTIVAGLQKITINILHNNIEILELEGYKANR